MPHPEDAKNIKAKILVLNGANDAFVPRREVAAFQDEIGQAGVDWQRVIYGGAVHSFTNPYLDDDPCRGSAYNEKTDKRSWETIRAFSRGTVWPQVRRMQVRKPDPQKQRDTEHYQR